MTSDTELVERLREPKTEFQRVVRKLAIAAQHTLYHDIDESMPEFSNGISYLEPVFSRILRGKLKARAALSREA